MDYSDYNISLEYHVMSIKEYNLINHSAVSIMDYLSLTTKK